MRRLVIIMMCVAFSVSLFAAPEMNQFAIKSGYIKYELTGSTKGFEELWWDDYGNKSCKLSNVTTSVKMFGMSNTEQVHSLELIVGDQLWTVNYLDHTGTHGKLPYYDESHEMVENMTEEEAEAYAKQIVESMGGEMGGTEMVKGYKCDKVTVLGFSSWMYKGMLLKAEGNLLGVSTNIIFTEFKPDSKVPNSKFVAPSDISYAPIPEYEDRAEHNVSNKQETETGRVGKTKEVMPEPEPEPEHELAAVACTFDTFKAAVMPLKKAGYKKVAIVNTGGTFTATFMKGLGKMFTITATPEDKIDKNLYAEYVAFDHKGDYYWYNPVGDGPLAVHYKRHKIYVVIAALKGATKSTLLGMSDLMEF